MGVSLELCWIAAFGVLLVACSCLAIELPFLHRFEPVEYDLASFTRQHKRLARSYAEESSLNLQFIALGRSFDLVLVPDHSVFHKDARVRTSSGPVEDLDLHTATYTGYDRNTPGSHLHGNMISGVFDGTVYTSDDIFYIEPAHRYARDTSFHSIIYRHSDIDREALRGARCGLSDSSIAAGLERVQRATTTSPREEQTLDKRQTRNISLVRCDLNMTGDYKFFQEVTKNVDNDATKVTVATSLLVSYVQGTSRIFQRTDFDQSEATSDNIQFGIRDLVIENTPSVPPFAAEFIGVEAFLRFHSDEASDMFCLSYRFTYRDFDGGVLGLAYVASLGKAGGICEDRLNTGIVTLLNYNQRVPTPVTVLTLAHEAGHNFGSEHDPEDDDTCSPGGSRGNYVMYAFANSGSQSNNDEFSLCSRKQMQTVIAGRAQDASNGCFRAADDLCQNGFLNDGEECDCGIRFDEDTNICLDDMCCNGMTCRLEGTATCSPDQGDCCNPLTCEFLTNSVECGPETDCAEASNCNGSSAVCPELVARTPSGGLDYILCNDNTSTCVDNVCNGSLCVVLNTESCECSSKEVCDVCCMIGDQCFSTIAIANGSSGLPSTENMQLANMLPGKMGRRLPVGTPCNDFRGYCDALNNCFEVDSEGALERLASVIFDSERINAAVRWVREHWWAVLAAGVGLLIGVFVIILIVHLLLPRPEHVKNRAQRRQTIRRQHKEGGPHPAQPQSHGREMRVRH